MTRSGKNSTLFRRCTSLLVALLLIATIPTPAQNTVTGAFEGTVTASLTGDPIAGAEVQIINEQTGQIILKRTDSRGIFFQGLLTPGFYRIRVSIQGYNAREVRQPLFITRTGEVVPVPVTLDPVGSAGTPSATPSAGEIDIRVRINTTDAQRGGSFTEEEVVLLPLGSTTLVRSFDELTLLLPGVALPPQTLGSVAGPGVGSGVGTSGQFAVNGLRSRGNNFTVDGSDNNDEDIGVRRQGFVSLIAQPIESVREYQAITLLAPAQFGRNIGAQVNAVSKSGGSETHGTVYGFFNSSQLNARNFFDSTSGSDVFPLRTANNQPVLFEGTPLTVRNGSGGEDSLTFAQGGFTLGGPVMTGRVFYFVSAEGQLINGTQEENFVVPTIEQRGAFGTGATGIFRDPFTGSPTNGNPNSRNGAAILSLFPFPNNPNGVYGINTFTQALPADSRGTVLSGKIDNNFKIEGREQSATGRYNFTNDRRDIPVTGGAIFSTLRPLVRTQNFSFFFNSELSAPDSPNPLFNQVRLSYGRTRLNFEEARDREYQLQSSLFPNTPFLLNAPLMFNATLPSAPGTPNNGPVIYTRPLAGDLSLLSSVEEQLNVLGQVMIAGYSPLGVDVFNFPQRRVNNTYQVADDLTYRAGNHSLAFGVDTRRSELNSDLPRNFRPLVTFNSAPRLILENGTLRFPTSGDPLPVIRAEDLAAISAPNNFLLTLSTRGSDSRISLRYYQLNFYGQDQWRVHPDVTISYGLRYEYNTPPRELNRRIENTFNDPALNLVPGLREFIDGRARIFEPDRNNFAPRVSIAYAPKLFGRNLTTVLRAGYGLFYDQTLGAVVSQSRNVFPTFLTLNFGGGLAAVGSGDVIEFFRPAFSGLFVGDAEEPVRFTEPGSLNRLNPDLPLDVLVSYLNSSFPSAISPTLPARRLDTPMAHHYGVTFEQQLSSNLIFSAAYVGTQGRNLLRFATPNLGPALTLVPTSFQVFQESFLERFSVPQFNGGVINPPRPVSGVGAINIFETTASSRYDSLQLQARGRFRESTQYQVAYTLSRAVDDVSDVFDLAGASALPQNSLTYAGERSFANYDARHRFSYNFVYDSPELKDRNPLVRYLLGNVQLASIGRFQTGQPFTVNSTIDVNLDGNLTDRLNTTEGIAVTGDRRQPLRLATNNTLALLAPFGEDGRIRRNTFRAGNILELDLSASKKFVFGSKNLTVRADVLNFINRANFGIPVRFLEAPGFGRATNTVTPGRRVQFSLRYSF